MPIAFPASAGLVLVGRQVSGYINSTSRLDRPWSGKRLGDCRTTGEGLRERSDGSRQL
jgi:hypothetical protein